MEGVSYVIVREDDIVIIDARIGGVRTGRVTCVKEGERLVIGDIEVKETIPSRRRTLFHCLRWFLPARPKLQLRRRGIGTSLLNNVLRIAEANNITEIWGNVTHDDLNAQPFLLNWYERHGFVVQEPDEECPNNAAKKVVRRIQSY